MRWLRIVVFMLGGVGVMAGCLLWVSQFFTGEGESTPVIWIENLQNAGGEEEKPFSGWEQEEREKQ